MSWKKLVNELDEDVWGNAYKSKGSNTDSELVRETRRLFAEHARIIWRRTNVREPREACRGIKKTKAPGPDGIPNKIVLTIVGGAAVYCLRVFNTLIAVGKFPQVWKIGRLVLLEKPKKSVNADLHRTDLFAFWIRLESCTKDWSPKWRKTITWSPIRVQKRQKYRGRFKLCSQHVLMVTLDVKNAFNSA